MIIIYEPREHLEVDTPKGIGRIFLVTEYGSEMEKVFTVIINETGEFWEFKNNQVKARPNLTMTGGFETSGGFMNMPFSRENGKIIHPANNSDDLMDGFTRLHICQSKTRDVLLDMLDVVEKGKSLGYFDCIIDLGTDAALINMLRNKYVDITNNKRKFGVYTEDEIKKEFRGGYSQPLKERLIRALTK